MQRILCLLLCGFCFSTTALARIELSQQGQEPLLIEDVYLRQGKSYVAIQDVVKAVGLEGDWDAVKHIFVIKTSFGKAWISPGSDHLHLAQRSVQLSDRPRFIDGRLRVTDAFIQEQLPLLTGGGIYYRNLDPLPDSAPASDTPLERLFSFLLREKRPASGPILRAVAIDPAHGGLDIGVLGPEGSREKQLSLALARQLEKKIKMRLGIPVYLSRDNDYGLTLEQRLAPAQREDVDAWILLHTQSSLSPRPEGVALFIRPETDSQSSTGPSQSLRLARHVYRALTQAGLPVQGIYRSSLIGLGQGNLPTLMVECGYLSHPVDRERLLSPDGQSRLATALFNGLRSYAETNREK